MSETQSQPTLDGFAVGDRVRVVKCEARWRRGMIGTVINHCDEYLDVEFEIAGTKFTRLQTPDEIEKVNVDSK